MTKMTRNNLLFLVAGLVAGTLLTTFARQLWIGSDAGARSTTKVEVAEPEQRFCFVYQFASGRKSTWRYCADAIGEDGRLECERAWQANLDTATPGEHKQLGQCKLGLFPKGLVEVQPR